MIELTRPAGNRISISENDVTVVREDGPTVKVYVGLHGLYFEVVESYAAVIKTLEEKWIKEKSLNR